MNARDLRPLPPCDCWDDDTPEERAFFERQTTNRLCARAGIAPQFPNEPLTIFFSGNPRRVERP